MPKRIDYILLGKELLAMVDGVMYRTILNKNKIVKLIGEKYDTDIKKKRTST
tara:strand:- start:47 stop:202 length:156 start_codon:yes stop_codon:yes gene_type:complete